MLQLSSPHDRHAHSNENLVPPQIVSALFLESLRSIAPPASVDTERKIQRPSKPYIILWDMSWRLICPAVKVLWPLRTMWIIQWVHSFLHSYRRVQYSSLNVAVTSNEIGLKPILSIAWALYIIPLYSLLDAIVLIQYAMPLQPVQRAFGTSTSLMRYTVCNVSGIPHAIMSTAIPTAGTGNLLQPQLEVDTGLSADVWDQSCETWKLKVSYTTWAYVCSTVGTPR